MSLYDDIFPTRRDSNYVQTEWAKGWGDVESGFGYAAEHLTKHRADFGATIDQAGLAIFFLQRHRVELGLKALHAAVRDDVIRAHRLKTVWDKCAEAVRAKDDAAWKDFAAGEYELIELLDRVDESSYAFRYPIDLDGEPVKRPQFINLDALATRVDEFHWHVSGFVDYLTTSP